MSKAYKVLDERQIKVPKRDIRARELTLLVPSATDQDTVSQAVRAAFRERYKSGETLVMYAYIEQEAIQWRGYVARAVQSPGGTVKVYFDNDPVLREALWREAREQDAS